MVFGGPCRKLMNIDENDGNKSARKHVSNKS